MLPGGLTDWRCRSWHVPALSVILGLLASLSLCAWADAQPCAATVVSPHTLLVKQPVSDQRVADILDQLTSKLPKIDSLWRPIGNSTHGDSACLRPAWPPSKSDVPPRFTDRWLANVGNQLWVIPLRLGDSSYVATESLGTGLAEPALRQRLRL